MSLNDLSGQIRDKHGITISKQGLNDRFSEHSVAFMKGIMEKLLKEIVSNEPVMSFLKPFKRVRIKDSTAFQLPEDLSDSYAGSGGSGSKAMIRIQFEYDCKTGEICDLSLHPFISQDATDAEETKGSIKAGDLVIRDLGYVSIAMMKFINEKKAWFINRLNFNTKVFEKIGNGFKELDFVAVHQNLDKHGLSMIEKEVYLGEKKSTKVRIVIERLPEDKVAERLRKAKKEAHKKGRQLSNVYKSRVRLNIFVTNIPAEIIEARNIRQLYRIRWQVELIFKVWKSVGEIDKVKKMKKERFETLLYAKLVWITLNWSVLWQIGKQIWDVHKIIISHIKAFKTLKDRIYKMWQAFTVGAKAVAVFINEICEMSPTNHRLEKKNKKLSSLEIMLLFSQG